MPRVLRSYLAEDDLEEIWSYIDKDNPAAAEKLIRRITRVFELLATRTGLGTRRQGLDDDVLVFPVRKYQVLFRRIPDGIEIVRVIHSARNIEAIRLQ
ncbi:MAG: type II toxin-antitoxin system RelE/ParE family toxin [Alphaproteobacteria bacterium]|nr:type II toxin-antitoxin system RelE/ParE family toxin [Alphaproteobacteria bacterium]